MHPLVWALTGDILGKLGKMTREQFAQKAGRSVSTFYAWRNGDRKSPKLLELEDFAAAVGLHVRLLGQDASVTTTEGMKLKPETQDVVRWMEGMPDEQRRALRAAAEAKMIEFAARPPEAVADEAGHRDRSIKSK